MTLFRHRGRRRLVVAIGALAVAAAAVGCGSTVTGTPVAQPGTVPAVDLPNDSIVPDLPTLPTEEPVPGGDVSIDVESGDCVRLGGTQSDATIENAVCGSPESNYVVVSSLPVAALCPTDIDQTYYETLDGVEQGALCLDIDFVVGGCMDLGTPDPERVDCSASTIDGVRVDEILQGEIDGSACATNDSVDYPERAFVVCVDRI